GTRPPLGAAPRGARVRVGVQPAAAAPALLHEEVAHAPAGRAGLQRGVAAPPVRLAAGGCRTLTRYSPGDGAAACLAGTLPRAAALAARYLSRVVWSWGSR